MSPRLSLTIWPVGRPFVLTYPRPRQIVLLFPLTTGNSGLWWLRLDGGGECAGFYRSQWLIPAYFLMKFSEAETCQWWTATNWITVVNSFEMVDGRRRLQQKLRIWKRIRRKKDLVHVSGAHLRLRRVRAAGGALLRVVDVSSSRFHVISVGGARCVLLLMPERRDYGLYACKFRSALVGVRGWMRTVVTLVRPGFFRTSS